MIGGITIGLRIQIEIHRKFRDRDYRKIGIVIGTGLSVARAKFQVLKVYDTFLVRLHQVRFNEANVSTY